MAYQALYRKYRPINFDEVIGQAIVNQTLKNALKYNKVSHAYLLSGPRGIGKTTLAKILAKSVNCLDLKEGNPCHKCKNCLESASRECSDIIEIDAASNNGVDEIRELKNKINLVPSMLKYKVYIIDEVHMLSTGAFNALLKTLEEPPAHVIFILATTDLNKVPVTIVSRCQCFNLKRIKICDIVERLSIIVKKENILIDNAVLEEIAKYADGGMRDAIGMLDKLTSYTSEKITMEDMRRINGLISNAEINEFIDKINNNDVLFILDKIAYLYDNGKDFIRFTEELILELRNLLVKKYIEKVDNINELFINKLAIALNHTLSELKSSDNKRVLFEIKLLEFMNLNRPILEGSKNINHDINIDSEKIISREIISEQTFAKEGGPFTDSENIKTAESIKNNFIAPENSVNNKIDIKNQNDDNFDFLERQNLRISNTFSLATRDDLNYIKNKWKQITNYTIDCDVGAVAGYLIDAVPVAASKSNLIVTFAYSSLIDRGNCIIDQIESFLEKIYNNKYSVVLLTVAQWRFEKDKYVANKKANYTYKYINEDELYKDCIFKAVTNINKGSNEELSELTKSALQMFGDNIVKIEK